MSKTRKKRSLIWEIPRSELLTIVNKSTSVSEVLSHFGLSNKGGNFHTLKQRLLSERMDYNALKDKGIKHSRSKSGAARMPALATVLVENSSYAQHALKRRVIKEGLIPYICAVCGHKPIWKGKELVLILDHMNGIHNDCRLENLRFVCPNCNSQLETHAGRKRSGLR